VLAGDDTGPARMRFHVVLTVEGAHLAAGTLRSALAACLRERFNLASLGISPGQAVAGSAD